MYEELLTLGGGNGIIGYIEMDYVLLIPSLRVSNQNNTGILYLDASGFAHPLFSTPSFLLVGGYVPISVGREAAKLAQTSHFQKTEILNYTFLHAL